MKYKIKHFKRFSAKLRPPAYPRLVKGVKAVYDCDILEHGKVLSYLGILESDINTSTRAQLIPIYRMVISFIFANEPITKPATMNEIDVLVEDILQLIGK